MAKTKNCADNLPSKKHGVDSGKNRSNCPPKSKK